ncbi:hypothetical protein [Streptomyces sp. NPDC056190]|uniref:hypothetical protein n=1 Tax=unclassified Streptomyces TaxID=2593676 RepID=UPI0035DB30F1
MRLVVVVGRRWPLSSDLGRPRDGPATREPPLATPGRLFTPAPWPDGGDPPGEPGQCYIESVSWAWASDGELVYVEGLGSDLAVEWAREGVPAELLADVGRPIPGASRTS